MSNQFENNRTRLTCIALLAVCAGVWMHTGGRHAQAQFKIPGVPKLPNIPNIGGGGSRQATPQDLRNLQEFANKAAEIAELDNPDRQQEIGQAVAVAITNRYPVSKNRALNEYVNLVGFAVASACPKPELNYAFAVLDTPEVGAYSTPGGYIFVTRGALNLCQDESELAGVLAHEVSHVVLNHGIQAVKDIKSQQLAVSAVQKYGQGFAAYSQLADEFTEFALVKGFSQQHERDADSRAVICLIRGGYDPRGLARFLDRLDKQNKGPANPNLRQKLFSTHPGTAERIGNITRQIATYPSISGATLRERYVKNVTATPVSTAPPVPVKPVAPVNPVAPVTAPPNAAVKPVAPATPSTAPATPASPAPPASTLGPVQR